MSLIFLRTLRRLLCSVWAFVSDRFPFTWALHWVHFLKIFLQLESLHNSHQHLCVESNITDHRPSRLNRKICWLAFWSPCPTSRKASGSIPDGVIGIFLLIQSFRSYYGPGVDSVSNRNECQEYFLGGKGGRCVGRQTGHLHVPIVLKSGSLNLLETTRPVQACPGLAVPPPLYFGYNHFESRLRFL